MLEVEEGVQASLHEPSILEQHTGVQHLLSHVELDRLEDQLIVEELALLDDSDQRLDVQLRDPNVRVDQVLQERELVRIRDGLHASLQCFEQLKLSDASL